MHSVYRVCGVKKKMHTYCILYSLLPFIDTLNGFVIKELNSNFSVGQSYRFLLIVVIFILMALYKKVNLKDVVPLVVFFIFFFFLSLIHVLLGGSISGELVNAFQWILFPIYVFGFNLLEAHGEMCEEDRKKILEIWRWTFPLTILVPKLLGVGYHTYGGEIGYKGFYYATNGVSFSMAILVIYSLYLFYLDLSIKNGINFGLCVWVCMTIGTKSCILAIVVAVVFLLFDKLDWKYFKRLLLFAAILMIAYVVFQSFIVEKINMIVNRYKYFSRILNNVFVDSITTGRTGKMNELLAQVQDGGFLRYLFGLGNTNYVAEMDFFDLFFQFGILGVLSFIMYAIEIKKDILKRASIYRRMLVFSMGYAFVVGHVFSNAMSTMVLALLFVSLPMRTRVSNVAGDSLTEKMCYKNNGMNNSKDETNKKLLGENE